MELVDIRLSLKEKPKDLSSKVKSYLIKDNKFYFIPII